MKRSCIKFNISFKKKMEKKKKLKIYAEIILPLEVPFFHWALLPLEEVVIQLEHLYLVPVSRQTERIFQKC